MTGTPPSNPDELFALFRTVGKLIPDEVPV